METGKNEHKSDTENKMDEFIKQNSRLLYNRESQEVGSRVNEGNKDEKKTVDGKFTKVIN